MNALQCSVNPNVSSSVKGLQQQLHTDMDMTIHDDSKLLEEHTEKMNYIKEELAEMKGMFEEMDFLVDSQQPEVEKLSYSVLNIKDNAMEGMKHLNKAAAYAVTARRNRCLLLLFLLVVSFVMGAFIWTMNKRHDGGKN
ncbi:hypothetical protein RFI_09947 [Reticulomyxa filosa]|uniref:t-SNARE coiled-coil homology domain-containing protein n=1 Tax=Reticulomyxa filosa TaxID=46433 RepID=X6NP89_RETFI|nr:hypothetical protein RFI_09947 [Reticulomyxa filosa]|eukprot:ETO27187.1 hypothetical protein RFI_09947 [Reticulomyxa filosa]